MVDPRPVQPTKEETVSTDTAIKVATPDIILFQDSPVGAEVMVDLIFQDIGGQEIINIARSDILNGQNVVYKPIKNITSLYFQYNPQNILALQKIDKDYFKNFPINLSDKLGPWPYIYLNSDGDLIIELVNMLSSESAEVQLIDKVEVLNDTIYNEGNA
jgi:hypothetical protein